MGTGAGTLVRGGGMGLLFVWQISNESGEPTLSSIFSSSFLSSNRLLKHTESPNDAVVSVVSFVRS